MGSKARESVKARSLAFVLLDFQHVGVRRRVQCAAITGIGICLHANIVTIPSTSSHTTAWTHKNVYCTHWYSGGGTVTGMGSTAPVAAVVLLLLLLVLLL